MSGSRYESEIEHFRMHGGILKMSDALRGGISRKALYGMLDAGVVERLSRGVYRLTNLPGLETPDLIAVAARAPKGVICLISALAFHELTTQVPHTVDLAIRRGSEPPRIEYPPVRLYWFSGAAYREGIEVHALDGVAVRIYSPEKAVADVFKYRNKLGQDVALEALRMWRQQHRAEVETLLTQARHCRVERVIKPYLEAML